MHVAGIWNIFIFLTNTFVKKKKKKQTENKY